MSFFSFFKVMTKKNKKKLEENQKKPNMSLRPNILWKVLVFGFLVFSRFRKNHSVEREEFY